MATANDILKFIDSLAPEYMKMEWDNVGLLCGYGEKEVKRVLVALDPFEHVCREAAEIGADLIVTHHPLIFTPQKAVTDSTGTGRAIMTLIENGICAINAHTNLDCAPGGVNDILAKSVGLKNVSIIDPEGTDCYGRPYGLLRKGETQAQPLSDFLAAVKKSLGCKGLRYVDGGKPVHKVAVGGGSCGDELEAAYRAGCDTFVTADVKYNQFWLAKELGVNMIDAGHFYTENPVCKQLADQIQAAFPEIEVILSKNHADCMQFYV